MRDDKIDPVESLAEDLGADRVVSLDVPQSRGPLDLLHLHAEVKRRLRSSGGRPSDPQWTVKRLVPFQEKSWKELEVITEKLEQKGQRVSPAQLAAILIERGLEDLSTSLEST